MLAKPPRLYQFAQADLEGAPVRTCQLLDPPCIQPRMTLEEGEYLDRQRGKLIIALLLGFLVVETPRKRVLLRLQGAQEKPGPRLPIGRLAFQGCLGAAKGIVVKVFVLFDDALQ